MHAEDLPEMIVGALMDRWPETVQVFIRYRMARPGCCFAAFMTVAEAAAEYGLDADEFARDLAGTIGGDA